MLDEAVTAGLRISKSMRSHLVDGRKVSGGKIDYVEPDFTTDTHKSLKGAWWLLEFVPKKIKYRRWLERRGFLGLYLPLAEPRLIPASARIHWSAVARKNDRPDYKPVNWPSEYVDEGTGPVELTTPA